jgi:hypothetical protein
MHRMDTDLLAMKLKDRIQTGLDENRILVLGSQLVLGFQLRSIFEKGFGHLDRFAQLVDWVGLLALVGAIGLLIAPSSFHRLVEKGEDTPGFDRLLTRLMFPALLPFVFGLATDFFVVGERLGSRAAAWGLSIGSFVAGIALLYLWELSSRTSREPEAEVEKTELKDKLRHVLTEARLVIPGAQALLGFQFVTVLMESFDKLPRAAKLLHVVSLSCVALSVVLLMAVAAYHRIAEKGEQTEHMHSVASALVLAATVPLGLGIAGDFVVATWKVFERWRIALPAGAVVLAFIFGAWFGLAAWGRARANAAGQRG